MKWYFKAFQNYFQFKGRANREEFWMFFLYNTLVSVLLSTIETKYGNSFFPSFYSLVSIIPYIAVSVRRLHDIGKNGWYTLIPIYNIILLAKKGSPELNDYGEIPISENLNQQEFNFVKRYKKDIIITLSFLTVTIFISGENSSFLNSSSVRDNLKNNLENLNGEWSYHNTKQDETWWLKICYDSKLHNGTYVLSKKNDSWGQDSNSKIKIMSEGSFELIEGYDDSGEKAYVGRNTSSSNNVFVITQLENKYAIDWLLRISLIEDQMFGEHMSKVSNNCN